MVMATYDNKHWLLSHIRHSFISTDDTGMCEIVMLGEDFPKQLYNMSLKERKKKKDRHSGAGHTNEGVSVPEETEDDDLTNAFQYVTEYDPYPEMEESDGDDMDLLAESYDIRCDMDFAPYRQRSNTAQRLEKMEQALKKKSKIKIVKWENPPNPLTNEERAQMFARKDVPTSINNTVVVTKRSLLSDQLAKCSFYPHSQYLEYAKFDGTAMLGVPTKTFKIFMTMLPEEQRNYPLTVCVVASAKVQDVIGFTCYKYSVEQPLVILGPAMSYGLFIAEDDGEMDWAFPCLDHNEPCSKFGLTHLGLVELKSKNANKPPEITCSIPEGGAVLTIEEFKNTELVPRSRSATVDSKDKRLFTETSLRNNQADSGKKDRRTLVGKPAVTFDDGKARRDEKTKTMSVLVDRLPKRLSHSYGDPHAESSSSGRMQQREALALMQTHHQVLEAPQYQSFAVQLCHRVRTNTPVLLGISGHRLEIDPRNSVSPKFWTRMKPVSYSMDMVAWCEIVEARSSKTTFRLVYSTGHGPSSHENSTGHQHLLAPSISFKHHDLECEHTLAKEIVEKINRILELRMSACRREYKAARERKLQARRSFHLQRQS